MRCHVALALWVTASSVFAGTPNYDAFSEPDGEIATIRQEFAAWKMLRDPEQLEAVYADAVRGMLRAVHVIQQLEATLAASGRAVAERSSRPGCLVPGYKELSGTCRPDWSSLDFLSKDRPGGARLRTVIFEAFAERARERGLENQAVLAAVNGLLSLELAQRVLLKAEAAASVPRVPGVAPAPEAPRSASPGPQAQAAGGAARAAPSLPAFVRGGKTAGVLRTAAGDLPLQSGWTGPASSIPRGTSGFDIVTRTHVEGHAAAAMRAGEVSEATLYINNPAICPSCSDLLPRMLPPGSRLTVVTPSGSTTFVGVPP